MAALGQRVSNQDHPRKGGDRVRLLVEKDDGAEVEVLEIRCIPPDTDTLVFRSCLNLRRNDVEIMERELSKKLGKRCVVVSQHVRAITGIKSS